VSWCERNKVDANLCNSVVNETPLTARTNRIIGGAAPSEYLQRLARNVSVDPSVIDKHVSTHLIDAELLRGR
jgi:hypothetical protein